MCTGHRCLSAEWGSLFSIGALLALAGLPVVPPTGKHRVLIANRGEIARRVIRTCKALGVETLSVFTSVDALAPHVRDATKAVCLGDNPREYTNASRLVQVGGDFCGVRLESHPNCFTKPAVPCANGRACVPGGCLCLSTPPPFSPASNPPPSQPRPAPPRTIRLPWRTAARRCTPATASCLRTSRS